MIFTRTQPRRGTSPFTKKPYSLRSRLILILFLSSLAPLIILGSISYFSMYAILKNKAEAGVKSNLHQVLISLEDTLSQLNHTSQQLAFDGRVGKSLESYLAGDGYMKKQLSDEIRSELGLIHFTNPTLGLMFYYLGKEQTTLFETYSLNGAVNLHSLPVLFQFNKIRYFGPHMSLNPIDGHIVLSILRQVELPDRDDVYVYIETNFRLAESIIKNDQYGGNLIHVIVDDNDTVVYSENTTAFPIGADAAKYAAAKMRSSYYTYEESSNQSWKVMAAIPKSVYRAEINRWIMEFTLFAVATLAASCLIAWYIWRTMYRPLSQLNNDIRNVRSGNGTFQVRSSPIFEFAVIHKEFADMRTRIHELISEVAFKEQGKAQLEVEKLMAQINPHFIYNTLDTVRWLARGNGQKDIDKLVSTLNKVLHYNLGKGGPAKMKDELDALKQYVELQAIRYNFQFVVNIRADAGALELPVPRFILQPLVENALYHGLDENSVIEVEIADDHGTHVVIRVSDNGEGMSEADIRRLLNDDNGDRKRVGLGIGLNYVYRMVKFQFGADASFHIESREGAGTTVQLRLPIHYEEA
ncbi:sensor histidine kinase [Paenibacillus ferrarius]|uniref:sensor histidine kinase n=1 Tax=Paenibacillus ferrarius TaxID=1469647 RepID=UPI003D27CE55